MVNRRAADLVRLSRGITVKLTRGEPHIVYG